LCIVTGIDGSLDGLTTATQRVNQVIDNVDGDKTLNNWFNPADFAQPATGTYVNSGNNAYLGPATRTVDLGVARWIRPAHAQRRPRSPRLTRRARSRFLRTSLCIELRRYSASASPRHCGLTRPTRRRALISVISCTPFAAYCPLPYP